MPLAGLQHEFSDFLRDRPNGIRERVKGGPHASVDTLLGIYRNAYEIRLIKILREEFALLHKFLGDTAFDRLAKAYLAEHPSRYFSVRWLGVDLAAFLAASDPWRANPELTQLAQLEWAQTMAFDAADVPLARREDLTTVPPADWPGLILTPHASVRVLPVSPDIFALWQALAGEEAIGERPPHFAPDVPHLVWRMGLDVKLRPLEPDEADALLGAVAGEPFAALCERLAEHVGADRAAVRAAELLDRWIAAGMIGRIEFSPSMSG